MLKSRKCFNVGGCLNYEDRKPDLLIFWRFLLTSVVCFRNPSAKHSAVKQLPRSYWQCGMCGGGRECTVGGPLCVFVGRQTPAS